MLQVIDAILSNPADKTKVSLVFANVTEEDILLKPKIDASRRRTPTGSTCSTCSTVRSVWTGGAGFITAGMLAARLPPPGERTKSSCAARPEMKVVSGAGLAKDQGEVLGHRSAGYDGHVFTRSCAGRRARVRACQPPGPGADVASGKQRLCGCDFEPAGTCK